MDKIELKFRHYALLVKTYQHHFDLFIKGVGLYILLVSGFAGFMFSTESNAAPSKIASFILLVSVVALFGLWPCYKWVKHMASEISGYEDQLHLRPLSLRGALGIIGLVTGGILIVMVAAIYYLV